MILVVMVGGGTVDAMGGGTVDAVDGGDAMDRGRLMRLHVVETLHATSLQRQRQRQRTRTTPTKTPTKPKFRGIFNLIIF